MLRRGGSSSSGSRSFYGGGYYNSYYNSTENCRGKECECGVACGIGIGVILCLIFVVGSCKYGYKFYKKKKAENGGRFFKKKQEEVNPNVYATPNGGIGLFCNKEHELEMYYGNPYSR